MNAAQFADLFKRNLCKVLLLGALTPIMPAAWAQATYPSQPIKIIVPFGPGGLADITMRFVGQKLAERLGQQVVVDNRPGAGGIVAAKALLAAPKDGHTLIVFSNGTAIGKSLFKLDYDPETDFTPISSVAYFDLILVTGKDSAVTDLKSLLNYRVSVRSTWVASTRAAHKIFQPRCSRQLPRSMPRWSLSRAPPRC